MSGVQVKLDKQINYQLAGQDLDDPNQRTSRIVDVDHCTRLIATQSRLEPAHVRPAVKATLEAYADAGRLERWEEHYGSSQRPDRADQYLVSASWVTDPDG